MAQFPSQYKFPILYANGSPSTTIVDMEDMFVRKEMFLYNQLWVCGLNTSGQLGNGNVTPASSPIQIGALTNWLHVTSGNSRGFGVKTDGTLWSWGDNTTGQLGQNSVTKCSSPIQVGSLNNWQYISAGNQTLGLKTDGSLWSWGLNTSGALGQNNTTNRSSPVQVGALTNWVQISSFGDGARGISGAIKSDGTLWVWGDDSYGGLGNNQTAVGAYSSPIQVGALTNWRQISVGRGPVAAIKTDGTLWYWGKLGISGASSFNYYSSPIQIGALTNWKVVSCGYNNTLAIKTDGSLWGWGFNANGELGNQAISVISSPIQVGNLTGWRMVSSATIGIVSPELP